MGSVAMKDGKAEEAMAMMVTPMEAAVNKVVVVMGTILNLMVVVVNRA